MFFEDEKDNLENLDNLDDVDLDLGDDLDDGSIDWDELLKDEDDDKLVSVASDKAMAPKEKAPAAAAPTFDELQNTPQEPKASETKDAFDIFGGDDENEPFLAVEEVKDEPQAEASDTPVVEEAPKEEESDDLLTDEELDAEIEQIGARQQASNSKLPVILGIALAALLVFGSILYLLTGKKEGMVDDMPTEPMVQEQPADVEAGVAQTPEEDVNPSDIPVVNDKTAKDLKPEKKITVAVETTGRVNPFLPTNAEFEKNVYSGIPSQALLPPETYGEDIDAQDLMKVSVSGILYDNVKPSAIITINGVDYFVQKGDVIDDYKVLDINRQAVVVRKGANIYKAGVGELLNKNFQIAGSATYKSGARYYSTQADDVEVNVKKN